LFKKIDYVIEKLKMIVENVNNENARLYATGVFQEFSEEEQTQLLIHVFVNSGLCLNIIKPDLEQLYIEKGLEKSNEKNIINGIVQQEFRKVFEFGFMVAYPKRIILLMNQKTYRFHFHTK
jgi:hypothetical protein